MSISTYVETSFSSSDASSKPLVIVTPLVVSHIQATIICSQRHGLQIRTRSGGHDYEGLSYVAKFPFVLIDLINLREIKVNVENKTAWVQAGATIGELYYKINEKSPNTWITSRCVAHYGHWWSLQWRWLWIFDA